MLRSNGLGIRRLGSPADAEAIVHRPAASGAGERKAALLKAAT